MGHAIATIVREEGVAAVYRGLSSALIRQAVYGTLKFGLYYSAKEALSSPDCRVVRVARDIVTREGVRGLWRGVFPTTQRAALVAGVQLPVYDAVKETILSWQVALLQNTVLCHMTASMV